MRRLLMLAALSGAALTASCVQNYAEREVAQGTQPATLRLINAPADARIVVDGRDVGSVSQHAGGLPLTAGRHEIQITAAGQPLHTQAVFASAGARVEVRIP